MKTDELREKYLAFFESKGHQRRPSDVLTPTWDPSVLFTPAGMNQFKDHFLGKVKLDFTRATTSQKCLRTGDIENVGRTAYHHTFFEMLGNFSFGDYFKREAIHWAWEFLTHKQWLGIDPGQLTVSVYQDDAEAAEIWSKEIGLPSNRIAPMGEDDNFWPAGAPTQGPDGVCGPCSEIFYHGKGGEVEIWNLVFTQFNRVGDPPDNLRPLPSRNIDTGMGLERIASVLQGVTTNYDIDILRPLVEAAGDVCDVKYDPEDENGRRLRRIADHIRACTFAIHENVYPGAHKEKYVIRRLLRRAVLDGRQMGAREPFLYQLVGNVAELMRNPYPELSETVDRVADVVQQEESAFLGTLDDGLARIEKIFDELSSSGRVSVSGAEAAELYTTHGVPPELFQSLAAERKFTFDWNGFREAMEKHRGVSGSGQIELFQSGPIESLKESLKTTEFLGYETTSSPAVVKGIICGGRLCESVQSDAHTKNPAIEKMTVVLDRTPFYGESGGQVGDAGRIVSDTGVFLVEDTQKAADLILHHGYLQSGAMQEGGRVVAEVDTERRQAIRRAHSATHVLHYALQKNLGQHAQQQGSKVDADLLRFDFTNPGAIKSAQLAAIQQDVDAKIADNAPIKAETLPLRDARQAGAMMLFGEKYPDPVRMISMGEFSRELCGGTHLNATGEIEGFEVFSEEAVSSGSRRVVALTGKKAREHREKIHIALAECGRLLDVTPMQAPAAVKHLLRQIRQLKKQLAGGAAETLPAEVAPTKGTPAEGTPAQWKAALAETARILNVALFEAPTRVASLLEEVSRLEKQRESLQSSGETSPEALLEKATEIEGCRAIVLETPGATAELMRQWIDQLRKTASPVAVLLASVQANDKVLIVAGISRDLVKQGLHAGNWVRAVSQVVGGGGGGKPDMAQAGGKQPKKLPQALEVAVENLRETLKNCSKSLGN